ncbi:Z1 domain-containing protein [Salmonella enterica]|nr:Z1 domain-containing protein [Salmonella enterica]EIB7293749.1 Z1 domain-containing protein [Salmonella enterica]EJL9927826.1 Z1 domain-containing protein [Salmonella enterica]ELY5966554.1 Z1 domain-containing protein [Salmonella enterica]
MTTTNMEQLEGIISTSINRGFPEEPPTESEFEEKALELRQSLQNVFNVSDLEFEAIKRRLKAKIVIQMDVGVAILDNKKPHQSWLPARRAELDFFFWQRYKRYLEEVKGWNPRVTGNLERVSDEIVDLLGNPKSEMPFQRRGLVLGDVQSGKTANYTAICNKAADTGYNVIIVLAGTMENLRQQTQERLDAEFSGRKSEYLLDPKRDAKNYSVGVGVGRYGLDKRIESFTSVIKDFDKNILSQLSLSLDNVSATVVFVIKKNKNILNNLIRWLQTNNTDNGSVIKKSLLLIDDEADNASVNTNVPEKDPTAINKSIRKLLKLFHQASYLGITATPYANIFIDPEDEDEMAGDDLFPRDFIYALSPPTNYIGAKEIFGDEEEIPAQYKDVLNPIDSIEMDAFLPFSHKKWHVVTELPPSMKESIAYFLLINGIRDIRGDIRKHRTMMIHVSRFTDIQNQIRDLVTTWVLQIRSDLQNYASLSEEKSSQINGINYLKKIWEKYGLSEKASKGTLPITWHHFLSEYLFKAVAPIDVRAVNQKSGATGLNYFSHKDDGLRVIAVGGNSLSRGLTLEGLCVSYFYRRSQMYDTLLQMGRWFGYRPDYDDLFKIWISKEAIDWYGYITAAAEELKLEIARMKYANLTPMDFGLKVRQDPASLIVTARNKMRSATPVSRPITISGRLLETPRLKSDQMSLKLNEKVFKDFISQLPEIGKRIPRDDARFFWSDVSKDEIELLLREFKTHPWQLNFQGVAIADFIRDNENIGNWDVFIAEGSGDEFYKLSCGDEVLEIKAESRAVKATSTQISISGTKVRVGAGGAAKIGLSDSEKEIAENNFRKIKPNARHIPDKAYLEIQRKPILILHVISVDKNAKDNNGNLRSQIEADVNVPEHIFALGIGIPSNGEEKTARYMVNIVEFRSFYDFDEDEDE